MKGEQGFTLVELMVATFITAILAMMGSAMLGDTLRARGDVEALVSDVEDLQLARAIIRRDLAQLVDRRAKDEFGSRARGPFEGGLDLRDDILISFVRTGHVLPGTDIAGSQLQYVRYLYRDGKLIRQTRAFVDAGPDPFVHEQVLLNGLSDLRVQFRFGDGWRDFWETTGPAVSAAPRAPTAVRFDLEHSRFGRIETVFLTVVGY